MVCWTLWWAGLSCTQPSQPRYVPPPSSTTTSGSTTSTTPPTTTTLTWNGQLEITNPKKYHSLLREQKRCDACSVKDAGDLSCRRFISLAKMSLVFEKADIPSNVTLTIFPTRRQTGSHFWFGACGYRHPNPTAPLVYKGQAKYINNYEGFYARFDKSADIFGYAGLSYLILKSDYGLPTDNDYLEISLYYGGSDKETNEMGIAELQHPNSEGQYISR